MLDFWLVQTPADKRFAVDPALDAEIARRFGALHTELAAGVPTAWTTTPRRLLAAVIVLDQFSRNLHRGSGAAFAQDAAARALVRKALARGDDAAFDTVQRQFLYLPLMHSEAVADQTQSVALYAASGDADTLRFAEMHRDVVVRFGRFPGRNAALGRENSDEERAWLAGPQHF